ncbi:MAG: trypsin-like peptidase domain-containing protein [Myxococcales bacterium]|nr:trypsin-like peptidase domain-containing protein [Myxococcales bacterium]
MKRRAWFVSGLWVAALLGLTACKATSSTSARYIDSVPPRYEVSCPAGEVCSESVALLVGLSAPREPTRCTAALVGPRTAVTAGHCVAWEMANGGRCDGLWLGFARSDRRPAEWIECARIESASSPSPSLLSPDYAVLKLSRDASRAAIPIGEGDVPSGEVVRVLSVTADRFYDEVHQVRSRRCIVDDNRRLVSAGERPSSSIRVLSSCPIRQGSSGAPVLDRRGRLRGLVHAAGPPYFAFGVMTLLSQHVDRDDG